MRASVCHCSPFHLLLFSLCHYYNIPFITSQQSRISARKRYCMTDSVTVLSIDCESCPCNPCRTMRNPSLFYIQRDLRLLIRSAFLSELVRLVALYFLVRAIANARSNLLPTNAVFVIIMIIALSDYPFIHRDLRLLIRSCLSEPL